MPVNTALGTAWRKLSLPKSQYSWSFTQVEKLLAIDCFREERVSFLQSCSPDCIYPWSSKLTFLYAHTGNTKQTLCVLQGRIDEVGKNRDGNRGEIGGKGKRVNFTKNVLYTYIKSILYTYISWSNKKMKKTQIIKRYKLLIMVKVVHFI